MQKIERLNKKRILALSAATSARQLFQGFRNMQPRETRARYDTAMNNLDRALKDLGEEPIQNWGDGVVNHD